MSLAQNALHKMYMHYAVKVECAELVYGIFSRCLNTGPYAPLKYASVAHFAPHNTLCARTMQCRRSNRDLHRSKERDK